MGKGIALEFKRRFPECFEPYKQACKSGLLRPGILLLIKLTIQPEIIGYKRPGIILFPTKDDWRGSSRVEWIEQGLIYLRNKYREWNLNSIALPQIGCGLGGLNWLQIEPIIKKYFSEEPIDVEIYLNAAVEFDERKSIGSF